MRRSSMPLFETRCSTSAVHHSSSSLRSHVGSLRMGYRHGAEKRLCSCSLVTWITVKPSRLRLLVGHGLPHQSGVTGSLAAGSPSLWDKRTTGSRRHIGSKIVLVLSRLRQLNRTLAISRPTTFRALTSMCIVGSS